MKFYTSFETADELGVHPTTLKLWRDSGRFVPDSKTLGGHFRYSEEQVALAKTGVFTNKLDRLLG